MKEKRRIIYAQTLWVNGMKLYRRSCQPVGCFMVPLLVPGPPQKMSYQKSFIIPGKQGRAGGISYTIRWKKISFFASFVLFLRPFATTKSTDKFRKIISIHLLKKMTGELCLFPPSPRYNQKEKIVSSGLRNFQLLEVSFPLCCVKRLLQMKLMHKYVFFHPLFSSTKTHEWSEFALKVITRPITYLPGGLTRFCWGSQ